MDLSRQVQSATSREEAVAAIACARTNQDKGAMASSARLCADDAASLLSAGDYRYAREAATRSLSYSLGFFSAEWREHARGVR